MVRILFIAGVLCLALGGWLYYDSLPPPECTFDSTEQSLPLAAGQVHPIIFKLTNPSTAVVRVVGLADNCGLNSCLRAKTEPPFDVPARSTINIECTVSINQPGEFRSHINCFLADPYLREIVLQVSGTATGSTSNKPTSVSDAK